jgi:aerobic carbon-monoxide dehydrogenase medium subunit
VKPAPFAYVRAVSVADAVQVLDDEGGAARVLAGGQSLVPMLNMRLMRPSALVDINGLGEELGRVETDGAETVVGALVRYAELEASPMVSERLPLLQHVARYIGDRAVRNRGTLGGALAQSDPTGEMPLACLALDARIVARSRGGERTLPVGEFFSGAYENALDPDELIVAIRFPIAPARFAFFERNRKHNDWAVLAVAALGDVDPDGRFSRVRLALGGVNDRPVLAEAAMRRLEGQQWDDAVVTEAADLALEAVDPPDDVRASAEYRRHLVPVHVRRVLRTLAAEASRGR